MGLDYSQLRRETRIIFVCYLYLLLTFIYLLLCLILISESEHCSESEIVGLKVIFFKYTQFNPSILVYVSLLHTQYDGQYTIIACKSYLRNLHIWIL